MADSISRRLPQVVNESETSAVTKLAKRWINTSQRNLVDHAEALLQLSLEFATLEA